MTLKMKTIRRTVVAKDDEDEQNSEGCGRQSEKVERHQVVCMIIEKAPPSMGRWGAMTNHILGRRLPGKWRCLASPARHARGELPRRGLALLMFRISSRISGATLGRPGLRRRLFQVQYRLNPQRCQRMTVSGFTMTRTLSLCLLFIHPRVPNLIDLRSTSTMLA